MVCVGGKGLRRGWGVAVWHDTVMQNAPRFPPLPPSFFGPVAVLLRCRRGDANDDEGDLLPLPPQTFRELAVCHCLVCLVCESTSLVCVGWRRRAS